MKQTINLYDFRQAFYASGREDNFSYEGLELLFQWLNEVEQEAGEDMELDVISLCCEFSEDTFNDIAMQYDIAVEGLDEDEIKGEIEGFLSDNTCLLGETETGFIYLSF